MIHLLFGGDELSLEECVDSLKAAVEPEELRDVNASSLDAQSLTLEELKATCDTVPFLAERRLVVVRGLLSQFEARPGARGGSGALAVVVVARRPDDGGRAVDRDAPAEVVVGRAVAR